MKETKKILIFITFVIIIMGLLTSIILIRNRQQIQKKAVVPSGTATISFLPVSGNYGLGSNIPIAIWFNTKGAFISAISARINYSYSGLIPEISASSIQISSGLLGTGDWSCPVKTITPVGGTVQIDIACINISTTGFVSSNDVFLGQFNLLVERLPNTIPFVLSFDNTQTKIIRKNDAVDILGTPSNAFYEIGINPTITPTLTPTRTPVPTSTLTPTSTRTPTLTSTPTRIPTPTSTVTITPSITPTFTLTPTATLTLTPTITSTPIITSTLTPIPTATITGLPTPVIPACSCPIGVPAKTLGNANCDNYIDGYDLEIFRQEYYNLTTRGSANFDCDQSGIVDGLDYLIWKNNVRN